MHSNRGLQTQGGQQLRAALNTMLERNFFTQDELALYDWRYSNYSFEQFYDELVRLGARTKRRKRDDDDYDSNPNRFLCDKVWNKRSNR